MQNTHHILCATRFFCRGVLWFCSGVDGEGRNIHYRNRYGSWKTIVSAGHNPFAYRTEDQSWDHETYCHQLYGQEDRLVSQDAAFDGAAEGQFPRS